MSEPANYETFVNSLTKSVDSKINSVVKATFVTKQKSHKSIHFAMNKSTEEIIAAQAFLDFFIELIETSKNLLKYYLSEDVVLDWFGKTVKGQRNVAVFIKNKINPIRHLLKEVKPVNKIGFRDTHVVKITRPPRRILRSSLLSPPRASLLNTPKKTPEASTSANRELPKRNINNNSNSPKNNKPLNSNSSSDLMESPRKKQKVCLQADLSDIDVLEPENDSPDVDIKYLSAEGHVEFHRPSFKKLQSETKWQRPCKVHIAYDCGKDVKDSTFYLIIYEGNVKCRRNLMKEFEAEEPEN